MIRTTARPSWRITAIAAAGFASSLVLSACATPANDPGSSAVDSTDIVGTWVAEKEYPTAPNTPFLTIKEDGDWAGSDGCNGGGGTWEITAAGELTVSAGASTLIACDGAPLPYALANAASAVRDGDTLTLTGKDGTETALIVGTEDRDQIN